MTLSVLSALSRLNVDPWLEAAELSELPKDTAALRLASLIARLPGGRWAQGDCEVIANRLIELLPRGSRSKCPWLDGPSVYLLSHSTGLRILSVLHSDLPRFSLQQAMNRRRGMIMLTGRP